MENRGWGSTRGQCHSVCCGGQQDLDAFGGLWETVEHRVQELGCLFSRVQRNYCPAILGYCLRAEKTPCRDTDAAGSRLGCTGEKVTPRQGEKEGFTEEVAFDAPLKDG
jgi:hypothetical protein